MRVVCHEASAHVFFAFQLFSIHQQQPQQLALCGTRKGMPWWGYLLYLPLLLRAKWIEAQILLALNEDLKSIFLSPGFWLGMLEHADWFTDGSLVELISKLPKVFCKKKQRHIFDFRVLVCFLKVVVISS